MAKKLASQIVFRVSPELYKRARKAIRLAVRYGIIEKRDKLSDLARSSLTRQICYLEDAMQNEKKK